MANLELLIINGYFLGTGSKSPGIDIGDAPFNCITLGSLSLRV